MQHFFTAMEALKTNAGNLFVTLVITTSLSISSSKDINSGKSISFQLIYV